MKKLQFLLIAGFVSVLPIAVMAADVTVPPGTTIVVDPNAGGTTVLAPAVSVPTQNPESSPQTTVIVDPKTGPRDAITNKPVEEKTTNEEKPSLRDKVRNKMDDDKKSTDSE